MKTSFADQPADSILFFTNNSQRLIDENKKSRSPFLDLGNCGLSDLPKGIENLEWLEELNLGAQYWDDDANDFTETHNVGYPNNLDNAKFAPLAKLKNLKKLSLYRCSIWSLAEISKLTGLQTLNLGDNDLSSLDGIRNLTNLKILVLDDNAIADCSALAALTNLKILALNINRLTTIAPLSALTGLEELHISGNYITDLEPVKKLTNLKRFDFSVNNVRKVRPLVSLKNLNWFNADRNNFIHDCPPDVALSGRIEKLREHFGAENLASQNGEQAKAVVEQPALEVKLVILGKSGSGKSSLVNALQGKQLKSTLYEKNKNLQIYEWPIDPALLRQTMGENLENERLRVYIWDFGGQEIEDETLNVFLDPYSVYIVLWDNEKNEDSDTEPQQIFKYWLDRIKYYAHLDNGPSNNLSVPNHEPNPKAAGDKKNESSATANDALRYFLVETKIDRNDGKPSLLDFEQLKSYKIEHFTGLCLEHYKSTRPEHKRYKYGFEIFRDDLIKMLYEQAKRWKVSGQVSKIRRCLREVREPKLLSMTELASKNGRARTKSANENPFQNLRDQQLDFLSLDDLAKGAGKLGFWLNHSQLRTLAEDLNRTGGVAYLPSMERVFIRPAWITDGLHEIFEIIGSDKGEFNKSKIEEQWREVQKNKNESDRKRIDEADKLFDLLQTWEFIFPKDGEGNYIAPHKLPGQSPMGKLLDIALAGLKDRGFHLRCSKFYAELILDRLIYVFGKSKTVREKEFWKNGLFFTTDKGNRILIKNQIITIEQPDGANREEYRVIVCVDKTFEDSNDWEKHIFTIILKIFFRNHLHNFDGLDDDISQHKLPATELKELAEKCTDLELSVNGQDFLSLATLAACARDKMSAHFNEKTRRVVRIHDFHNLLEPMNIETNPPTIFFSYSHDDKEFLDQLKKHLGGVTKRLKIAEIWDDSKLNPGSNWKNEIGTQLKSAEIIVLMISASFINSNFIWGEELSVALDRQKRGECRIIPVLIKPCDWDDLPFSQFEMLPKNLDFARLVPVSKWQEKDEAYAEVVKGIKRAIQDLKL